MKANHNEEDNMDKFPVAVSNGSKILK